MKRLRQSKSSCNADRRMALLDERTALVKAMVAKENAELESKTARLRALRLARPDSPES